jgi:prepilin-type N-terminal cleavage/methylation domain-containing protein
MKKQDEGFTLIELLIVIIILGILATVVVFAVAGIRDSGDKSACEAELRSVETARGVLRRGRWTGSIGSSLQRSRC